MTETDPDIETESEIRREPAQHTETLTDTEIGTNTGKCRHCIHRNRDRDRKLNTEPNTKSYTDTE